MQFRVINLQSGYIALISAIIISVLLLAITFALSFSGFFARFNILTAEYKKRSQALAEACVDIAMLRLANKPDYVPIGGGDSVPVGGDTCTITAVDASGSQKIIHTQGIFSNAYTKLLVTVTPGSDNIVVNAWQEVP